MMKTTSVFDSQIPADRGDRHRSVLSIWQSRGSVTLLLLTLIGYPFVGLSVAFSGVESQIITLPFRAVVLSLSLVLLASGFLSPLRGRLDFWLFVFLILYLFRLLFDLKFNSIPGNVEALQYYLAVVFVPIIAISASGLGYYDDQTIGRWLLVAGLGVAVLALLAESMGLAFNPWADQGVDKVRLGFGALNPISLGHAATTTALAGWFFLTTHGVKFRWRVISLIAIALGGIILLQAGSRGALVALVICILWFGTTKIRRLFYLGPAIIFAMALGLTQSDVFQHTMDTISGGWALDGSSLARLESQSIAIEDFFDAPVIGKHHANPALEQGTYPHNLIIETAMALGVIGLLIFVTALFRAMRNVLRHFNREHPLLTLLLIQQFVNASLSGSLWTSNAFFILLMLALKEGDRRQQPFDFKPRHYPTATITGQMMLARENSSASNVEGLKK